jgi:hypothetical protein
MTFAVTLLILGLATSSTVARGLYLGAGIGNTFFSSEYKDALEQIKKIDENATAWKIFGGFHAGKFLGIEGGYRSFGQISSGAGSDLFESKTTGWDIEGLGRLQIAIIDIFGKAGVMFSSTDVTILGQKFDTDSSTDFFWGLGAGGQHVHGKFERDDWVLGAAGPHRRKALRDLFLVRKQARPLVGKEKIIEKESTGSLCDHRVDRASIPDRMLQRSR